MTGLTPDQDPNKDGVPLDAPPSTRQGFGRMQLSNSLPLSSGSLHMQVCTCPSLQSDKNGHIYMYYHELHGLLMRAQDRSLLLHLCNVASACLRHRHQPCRVLIVASVTEAMACTSEVAAVYYR